MGLKFKVDGVDVTDKINLPSHEEIEKAKNEYMADKDVKIPSLKEIPMSKEMTERLWEIMAENSELSQKLYIAEHRLEQIKRLVD